MQLTTRLAELEAVVSKGMASFVEVGNALIEIRDAKLYVFSHKTFEAYCSEKWSLARRTAYQLMSGAEVAENVRNCAQVAPEKESQVRPLTKLKEPEQQREAWTMANEASNGKPTAKHVEAAVETVKAKRPIPEPEFTPEQQKTIEEAEKDSEKLWLLKSAWKKTPKKDRALFLAWIKTQPA